MLWQTTIIATIRAVCAVATLCLATGLSVDELAAPYEPVPVIGPDGEVVQ
jgi:hypothetical protein